MQQQMLIYQYDIPRIEMLSFVLENLAPILLETPRSGPLNFYILHRSYGTHYNKSSPDYSTFSGGQAACPLLEVTGSVLQLTFSQSCSSWCFSLSMFAILYCQLFLVCSLLCIVSPQSLPYYFPSASWPNVGKKLISTVINMHQQYCSFHFTSFTFYQPDMLLLA